MKSVGSMTRMRRREARDGILFILPAMIPFLLFCFAPLVGSIYLSMTNYNIMTPPKFVGLENYVKVLTSPRMWNAMRVTFTFAFFSVVLNNMFGLLFATMINRRLPNAVGYLIRLFYFLPVIIAYVYVSVIWSYLFTKDTGIINFFLQYFFNMEPIGWILDQKLALGTLIFIDVWKNCGLAMIIYLAGLRSIPSEQKEAARIDGATSLGVFRHVTLPLLSPIVLFNMIIFLINALQVFEPMQIITRGGPVDATRSIVMFMLEAFNALRVGDSTTISVVLLVLIMILTLLQFKLSDKWVYE